MKFTTRRKRRVAADNARRTLQRQARARIPNGRDRNLLHVIVPTFDELSLFLMSVAFLLLCLMDNTLRTELCEHLSSPLNYWALVTVFIVLLFVIGIFYPIYHVFTKRHKTEPEKLLMLFFAVVICYASGLTAGIHVFRESSGWVAIFPLWNLFCGIVLMVLSAMTVVNEKIISDENASIAQVVVELTFLCGLLIVCQYALTLYWAVTFSICVGYATTLSRAVQWLCGRNQARATSPR